MMLLTLWKLNLYATLLSFLIAYQDTQSLVQICMVLLGRAKDCSSVLAAAAWPTELSS